MADLRRLEQFVAVAQHGSFGRAATALFLSQPSLTRGIRALEADLGAVLFERGPTGAVLTGAGETFLPRARALIEDFRRARAELDPAAGARKDQVRLGLSPNFLHHLAPGVIAAAVAGAAGLNIQVYTGTAELLRQQLRTREIDLAFNLAPDFPVAPRAEAADLAVELVGRETIAPFAAPDDPAARGPASLEALAARRWATPYQLSLVYRFETAFERRKLAPPVQSVNSASLTFLQRLATEAGLVVMLPRAFAAPPVAAGVLAPVDCPELVFDYAIALTLRSDERSLACLALAQALTSAAGG
jgi:DNA-binding transcriptional LysR family regulator